MLILDMRKLIAGLISNQARIVTQINMSAISLLLSDIINILIIYIMNKSVSSYIYMVNLKKYNLCIRYLYVITNEEKLEEADGLKKEISFFHEWTKLHPTSRNSIQHKRYDLISSVCIVHY